MNKSTAFALAAFLFLGISLGATITTVLQESPMEALIDGDCAWYPIIEEASPEAVEAFIMTAETRAFEDDVEIDYATEQLSEDETRVAIAVKVCDSDTLDEMEHAP